MNINIPKKSKGLPNCGNSCFMNSVLQMLYSIDGFREKILNYNKNNEIIEQLSHIFQLLEISNKKIKEKDLINSYNILYKSFSKEKLYKQQDAREFLSKILEIIEDNKETNLEEIYRFNIIKNSYCLKKKSNISKEEQNSEKNLLLVLDINKKSIQESINLFQIKDAVSLHRCNNNEKGFIKNIIQIPENNNYLIINLKRYKNNGSFNKKNIEVNNNIKINNDEYFLIGAILKSGSADGGHYVYSTYKNGKIHFTYDDSSVYNHEPTNMNIRENAYILLYKRVILNNLINKINNKKKILHIK